VPYGRCVADRALRTCLGFAQLADVRWGAQLADVPCICVTDVRWGAQIADVPCVRVADVWAAQLADVPCVADVRSHLALRTLCCVWATQPW
jgi:hypothetical protein